MINTFIDKIYVINLQKQHLKKEKCLIQFKNNNITNYKFIQAVDTVSNNCVYNNLYNKVIENMTEEFIKNNFTKGAMGCLLSHIECLKDAKQNNYKNILILEDDFIIIKNFDNELNTLIDNISDDWDFIYLGKKQGDPECVIDINDNIHNNKEFFDTKQINNYVYRPNYKTWATHALLIKNTIFDDIIRFQEEILGPIDLMLMTLYSKYNFYCVLKDLFVSFPDLSDIQSDSKKENQMTNYWNWDYSLYTELNTCLIKNIIIFGFKNSDHTHKYIHNMYYEFFKFYYPHLNIYWYDDDIIEETVLQNSIIFCSPCHMKYTNLPQRNDIFYILHCDDFNDNVGYKTVEDFFNEPINSVIYNSKKYIVLLCREKIKNLDYFEKNIEDRTICLPWFSNDLYTNILEIKNNLDTIYDTSNNKKYLCYIGSIWYLNIEMIKELIDVCETYHIPLLLKGRVFGLNEEDSSYIDNINTRKKFVIHEKFDYTNNGAVFENSFEYINDTFGVKGLLPFQGGEHNDTYISNRIFETISRGYLVVTNNLLTKKYFESALYGDSIESIILKYYAILSNKELWKPLIDEQINEFLEKFYGYKNIEKLFDFLKETSSLNNELLVFDNNNKSNHFLWFTRNSLYTNSYYSIIRDNEDIRKTMVDKKNYIVYPNTKYDKYLIEQLISFSNYIIHIDSRIENKQLIIDMCQKHNKIYTIKNTQL